MKNNSRRDFLKRSLQAGAASLALSTPFLAGCSKPSSSPGDAPAVQASRTYRWTMLTTWPPTLPVLQDGPKLFADWVREMSNGQLDIQVYGGGELVPSLEAFDAVRQGTAEIGHGASYYWAGKVPAAQFFAAVPFGMNPQQMNAWLQTGDGMELWEQVYEPFNLLPLQGGNTAIQMGGWFNREINSVDDLKGLKMRIPGLGGKVISKAGGSAVLSAGGEIYTNLERGVIDATEWIGPYHDYMMGFYKVAKYYYYPGWHEPGTNLEFFINKTAFSSLPEHLQTIVRTAAARVNHWMLSEFEAQNNIYLQKLIEEENVQLKPFPDDVLDQLRRYSGEVLQEITERDAQSRKIYDAYQAFRQRISEWNDISERVYYSGKF
ncbi:TRAP transporter substrate-binding protein [Prosthecochloris sp. N3]|uniref:TRAP transporter substrate-binding protein n=1 Tax=Prosthecochloris ethylica TaxID=2743976 RepID=A0ABR9XS73_9CHLB|nr:TRAP transporter substrate-binding protein [Prosthecochloris ethylica]MBF0586833.1 TRAP transporter substrate-binding protein [Prosthecochloris ethylica]MBF0636819.1 TRAP transporter substrate-binding protein [Prosthecochloris ethylica]MEC9487139.1 TRAP transporter substrate-binding protein [Prosthecochloris sp.]NUK48035.1 TRAP transporter substrate-binding protein [Prosthecochloris ethylica]